MRRSLALLLSACLAALALLAVSPSAEAAPSITGRLVPSVAGNPAVAGMTVKLIKSVKGSPTTVVDTAVTGPAGGFSLNPGGSGAVRFFVRVVPGEYQGGWVGGGWVQPAAFAKTFTPGAALGDINANPAFIRGVVVDSVTKEPVGGLRVTARSQDQIAEVDGADLTDADGAFRINGLTCEDDCYLKINGSGEGFETGFRACDAGVVAAWPDACASPIGRIGRVFLDQL
jgi:hypothetical protein